jgi:hypothetical protein
MRYRNCTFVGLSLALFAFFFILLPPSARAQATQQTKSGTKQQWVRKDEIPKGTISCVANAPAGYPNKACLVNIDRDAPVSPPTLVVPGGTTIYIEMDNARWDEIVAFTSVRLKVEQNQLVAGIA